MQHFAHDDEAILAGRVRIQPYRLEHTVRTLTLSLLSRTAVEAPQIAISERLGSLVDNLSLCTEVGFG